MSDKPLKLVRVVLFLPWESRDDWEECLQKAVAECHQREGWKNYTGRFSQYPLLSNPNTKLFGNFDIWRFIEFCEAKTKAGKTEKVLCDSYVYFSENMEQVGRELQINELKPNKHDGGFDCKYFIPNNPEFKKTGVLRGFPLPLPEALVNRIEKDIMGRYVRCPHATERAMPGWNVLLNITRRKTDHFFRDGDRFSACNFLKRGINMKTIVAVSDRFVQDCHSLFAVNLPIGPGDLLTFTTSQHDVLYVCKDRVSLEIIEELGSGDAVYIHHEDFGGDWAGDIRARISARGLTKDDVEGFQFSIKAWEPDDVKPEGVDKAQWLGNMRKEKARKLAHALQIANDRPDEAVPAIKSIIKGITILGESW